MFVSLSKCFAKFGAFHFGIRLTKKNAVWLSIVMIFVWMLQLTWYALLLSFWMVYAVCYAFVWLCKKIFKRKKKDPKPVNTLGQDLNKLIDGELPFGWVVYFQDFCKPKDSKMRDLAVSVKGKKGQERIAALQTLIEYFYSYKEECRLKGECFEKYFDNMWMHCHNSRCNDFIYITPYEEELATLLSE